MTNGIFIFILSMQTPCRRDTGERLRTVERPAEKGGMGFDTSCHCIGINAARNNRVKICLVSGIRGLGATPSFDGTQIPRSWKQLLCGPVVRLSGCPVVRLPLCPERAAACSRVTSCAAPMISSKSPPGCQLIFWNFLGGSPSDLYLFRRSRITITLGGADRSVTEDETIFHPSLLNWLNCSSSVRPGFPEQPCSRERPDPRQRSRHQGLIYSPKLP